MKESVCRPGAPKGFSLLEVYAKRRQMGDESAAEKMAQ
jgi:hypothetical protein